MDLVVTGPKISVIMPARNVERYIDEAIQSVLKQRGASFELLVFDDASEDGTLERIQSYAKDPKIRIWKTSKRKGAGAARNFLISRACGRFLTFCDADDKLLPSFLAVFSGALKRHRRYGGVYGNRLLLKGDGKPRVKKDRRPSGRWDLVEGMLSNTGVMIRRSLIKRVGGYRTDLPYLEDCEFFSRLAEVTSFFYLKAKPLYAYRKRRRGSLSKKFKRIRDRYYLAIVRKMISRRYGVTVRW